METLAAIIDVILDALHYEGVVEYSDTSEIVGTIEIEANNSIGSYPYIWTVKAFGWYVFLWKYSASDTITAYHADEICQHHDHTSLLPLQDVNGKRLCVDCAGYTSKQVQVVYDEYVRRNGGDMTYLQHREVVL